MFLTSAYLLFLNQHHQQHPSSTVTSESLLQHQQQQLQNGNEHHGSGAGAEMLNLAADSPDNKVKILKIYRFNKSQLAVVICNSLNFPIKGRE